MKFVGVDGDTAYEGFVSALPRSMDDSGHTLNVSTAGWMAHAQDEPFSMIFVDRDPSRWQGAATNRRVDLLGGGYGAVSDPATSPDQTGRSTIRTAFSGAWGGGQLPISEAWYDAGPGNLLDRITTTGTRGPNVLTADGNWRWRVVLSDDDRSDDDSTANLHATGPVDIDLPATAPRRFAMLQLYYNAAGGGDGYEYAIDWSKVAVYGDHGLPLLGTTAPYGVAASDVIRYLAERYCPLLNTAGVQETTYPIAQLAFYEDADVYDAWLKVNSYHLWQLAVWEGRTLHYAPVDLTDWDWEVRHDEVGTVIGLQGDEYTQLRNGIIVTFTNAATGRQERLHPDDHAQLRDDSIDNPYNQHGRRGYGDVFAIPFPTTEANALELGRVRLIEDNAPKAPGSFTIAHHVRDRAGNLQPAWKVRADDRIRLTSSAALSDRPRLIQETSYTHDSPSVTISVDATFRTLDAYLDRVQTDLSASGLQ